jgi:hypothetical protein
MMCVPLLLFSETGPPATRVLVVCSPGSPGTTLQAQATMDAFATAAAMGAGWQPGSLAAIYFEALDAGVDSLKQADAALAMVSLPFFLRYEKELGLAARLEAQPMSGPREVWSLVTKKDAVASAAALSGWEITGGPGFYPEFVRGIIMQNWGRVPADARITFTARALTALRRAAAGEKVAVVLDREQTAALGKLPFGADLAVATESAPVPSGYLCTVGQRLPDAEAAGLLKTLGEMDKSESGRATLTSLRMSRFAPVDAAALAAVRKSLAGAAGPPS